MNKFKVTPSAIVQEDATITEVQIGDHFLIHMTMQLLILELMEIS
jgi:acyl-[acyl carrier protein]--UDP-N-acetylglucosamine O-acyltransferase